MHRQLRGFAAGFGITDMVLSDRMPCTRPALAMAEYARDQGKLHPFRAAVMDAWWRHGQDIEDQAVLAGCARAAGLDEAAALAATRPGPYTERIAALGEQARRARVSGIPTIDVGRQRVVGCQPFPAIEAAAVAEGATRRASP
jgi:predicted DsbA family dithiol-disulfide isomerase